MDELGRRTPNLAFLSFERGSIVVKGGFKLPNTVWDERVKAYRAPSLFYRDIIEYLKKSKVDFVDEVQNLIPSPEFRCRSIKLRKYQRDALRAWDKSGRRGVVVLPTGSGKTVLAIKAIELVSGSALVVVPTLDLMEQWKERIHDELGVDVGVYGGGDTTLGPVTVSTYDSAYLRAGEIGNRFSLLICDELHHLAAEGYRQIAEMFTAPYRLGLTATFEREDMLHEEIPRLMGGVVYRLEAENLTGKYLSNYTLKRLQVELTPDEKKEYDTQRKLFTSYLETHRIWIRSPMQFRLFIMRTARDAEARRALLARNRALTIAFNSESKIDALERVLRDNPDERTLIFTQHNDLVYRISRRFLIPFITHTTDREERQEVLARFKDGSYRAIVTSKVLDEGIDVPEASLGIILSGTGSSREFVQRLGRLLRKKEGKEQANLVEIISSETTEMGTSTRRRKGRTATTILSKQQQRRQELEEATEAENGG